MEMSVRYLKYSATRCEDPPLPADEKLSLPGLALACATNSCRVLTGKACVLAITTIGTLIRWETGLKSSKGS
ncbi:hypothetical protein D3C87_1336880 [compost metagenome]